MPRLRATFGLSLLAAAVAVPGTLWLSHRSDVWNGPDHPIVRVHTAPPLHRHDRVAGAWHPPPRVIGAVAPVLAPPSEPPPSSTASIDPQLVPVSMPPLADRYESVRGHLDGDLTLVVTLDASGHALTTAVQRSSGDAVLDAYAQRLVSRWRFAVPASTASSTRGLLPMHFGSSESVVRSP